jgi:Amt family ammonium transporter
LLWIGWFGFNGGSVGSISSVESADLVAKTIINTNTAGLCGAIIAGVIMYIRYKLFDITMILNGALGGLVAVTAAANLYDMYTPILVGFIGGGLVVFAVPLFDKLKLDDPVGALSVHLVNGIWGTLAAGIFIPSISLMAQLKGIVLIGVFTFSVSYIVLFIINKFFKFRADDEAQLMGMDINECGVEAYPEFKRAI